MKTARKLEYARWVIAGAMFGSALCGSLFGLLGLNISGFDHGTVGAAVGGIATAFAVKMAHLV
jgi:hypothetical protein